MPMLSLASPVTSAMVTPDRPCFCVIHRTVAWISAPCAPPWAGLCMEYFWRFWSPVTFVGGLGLLYGLGPIWRMFLPTLIQCGGRGNK